MWKSKQVNTRNFQPRQIGGMGVAFAITNRTAKENITGELLDANLARQLRPDMDVAERQSPRRL